jgi:hypothetical protein
MIRRMTQSKIPRAWLSMLALAVAAVGATTAQAAEKAKPPASIWEQDTLTGDWGGAQDTHHDLSVPQQRP